MNTENIKHKDILGILTLDIDEINDNDGFYKIAGCSPEMMIKPKPGRKRKYGPTLPLAALKLGQSFNVPPDRPKTELFDIMRKAQRKWAKFRLVVHANHYEIGRIE